MIRRFVVPYPPSRRSDLIDTLHGVDVADPYRWLENAVNDETTAWVDAQNALTRSVLDGPDREILRAKLTELFNHPRVTAALRRGAHYFFNRNAGLQPQATLFVQEGPAGRPRVLIDPNTLSADGTAALTAIEPSADGTEAGGRLVRPIAPPRSRARS